MNSAGRQPPTSITGMPTRLDAHAPGWFGGLSLGSAAGAAVWIGFFAIDASGRRDTSPVFFVLPSLAVLIVGALLAAAFSDKRRKWWLAVGSGIFLTVPIAFAIFLVLLVIVDPI